MRKAYIMGFIALMGLILVPQAKASSVDTTQIFGFMNGNYYDANGALKYFCFMNGKCYNFQGQVIEDLRTPQGFGSLPPEVPTATPTVDPTAPPAGNVIQPVSPPVSNNLPAYTEDQLIKLIGIFHGGVDKYSDLPISVVTTQQSVIFNWQGDFSKRIGSHIVFNGSTVLDEHGADTIYGNRDWIEIGLLAPSTTYTYQYVYHEDGRDDTIITRTFKTRDQQ